MLDVADLRDLQFPQGGFSVKMLTPLMDYHVTYQDADAAFARAGSRNGAKNSSTSSSDHTRGSDV